MPAIELRFELRHLRYTDRINGSDANRALHLDLQLIKSGVKFIAAPQDVAAHIVIETAGGGHKKRTNGAIEPLSTIRLLKFLQMLARRSGGDAICLRPPAQAFHLHDIDDK